MRHSVRAGGRPSSTPPSRSSGATAGAPPWRRWPGRPASPSRSSTGSSRTATPWCGRSATASPASSARCWAPRSRPRAAPAGTTPVAVPGRHHRRLRGDHRPRPRGVPLPHQRPRPRPRAAGRQPGRRGRPQRGRWSSASGCATSAWTTRPAELWGHAIVGMVHMAGDWWVDRRTFSREQVVGHLVDLLWDGLGSLDQRPG